MADPEKEFGVEVNAGGRKMSGTTNASTPGELIERATERFGIRLDEIRKVVIESGTIEIKIIPSEIADGERL